MLPREIVVPVALLRDRRLTMPAKMLMMILTAHADHSESWPGLDQLADELGIAASTARLKLQELIRCGYVGKTGRQSYVLRPGGVQ